LTDFARILHCFFAKVMSDNAQIGEPIGTLVGIPLRLFDAVHQQHF
jgi:hypothetical protein